jgi:predicted small lipoprotein YifL
MRTLPAFTVIAVLGLAFQACGQKGPLRLPDRSKPTADAQTKPSAPVTSTEKPQEP